MDSKQTAPRPAAVEVARPTAMDEYFVHQIPEVLPNVVTRHPHWRESYFFEWHEPDATGDLVAMTLATYPFNETMDSLQGGRIGGKTIAGRLERPYDGDPHTLAVPGMRIDVVRPFEELHVWADPGVAAVGVDLTFRARTQPYVLRRGTLRAGNDIIWDQSHILQSGTYTGSYTVDGVTREVGGWVGQRDHSWGIRDRNRCPLWIWLQLQFEDGFLGVWHWELANGTRIYTDGCWAGTDGSDPIPIVDFQHEFNWVDAEDEPVPYGKNGNGVAGLIGRCTFTLAGGKTITVEGIGTLDLPYEWIGHRGGTSQMRVHADDGRTGTAVYEVTGVRHHRYFPDTVVEGELPS